jgi:hypothetical protein
MSALPPKADIAGRQLDVRFVPTAEVGLACPFGLLCSRMASAAQSAAAEQELPGDTETIEYEDEKGEWQSETVCGRDRLHAVVKDSNN